MTGEESGKPTKQTPDARVAPLCSYPLSLARCERKAIRRRRQAALPDAEGEGEKEGHYVGVAISGGGIRSATFALGIFQALARGNLLKHVDYLSTVSGGGYFGSFLGALYARPEPEEPDCEERGKRKSQDEPEDTSPKPEKSTRSEEVRKRLTNPNDVAINYLRENGRYLAPAGTSDLLLGGAVLLRNWVTLQVIVMSFLLFVFLGAEWVLLLAFNAVPNVRATKGVETFSGLSSISEGFVERLLVEQGVWLSPWLVAPLALFVIAGMPLSWSYWTLGRNNLRAIRGPWKPYVEQVWAILPNAVLVGSLWFVLPQSPALAALGSWVAIYAFFMAQLSACKRRWVLWTPYLVGPVIWYGLGKSELLTDWTTTEQGLAVFGVSAAAYAVVMLATKRVSHCKQNATAKRAPHHKQNATTKRAQDATTQDDLSADDWQRHRVSVALRTVLMGCALLLAFAVIDTLGRSIYVAAVHDPGVVLGVSGSLLTFLWTAATFARRVVVRFASTTGAKRPGTGLGLTAWVAAIVLVATVLTGAALGAQAIVWQGCGPTRGPSFESEEMRHTSVLDQSNPAGVEFLVRYPSQKDEENTCEDACDSKEAAGERSRLAGTMVTVWDDDDGPFGNELSHTLWMMLAALGASIVLGSSRVFLNRSSHLPLYSARLTRAYLGASNRGRFAADDESDEGKPQPDAATRVIACDDIGASEYWGWGWNGVDPVPESAHWVNGGPLHIVNVTINETVDGRSQIQQNDRKGLGLAVGPCGLSAGKRHHLLPGAAPARKPVEELAQPGGHYVFRFDRYWRPDFLRPPSYPAEELSLGQWMSISGAAFSTGLGSRTNQGLSLLAGMTNIRLGYWWRPGIAWRLSLKRVFGSLFWVQTYLFREMLARFPGTQNALWYLSDGGHFENMGGYELIRRRLPFIVIIDGEADSKYQFEGLGNLVRKARIDFGAEIEFLPDPLGLLQEPGLPVGPLSHLRRGKWEGNGQDRTFETVDVGGYSIAHAALATVRYDGNKGDPNRPSHLLLYIKPTLLESRPADMDHYTAEHGDFPHQSTGDQFFDEAQWESYRKLGEMIGERLFPSTDGEAQGPLSDAFRGTLPINDRPWVRSLSRLNTR